ncbi:hypothetical protein KKC87_01930 [Patescibacteria group bacterium]|nr:hypothetical protein [Patescibacteria group bacterium]
MAVIFLEEATIDKLLTLVPANSPQRKVWDASIKKWNLARWEEELFYQWLCFSKDFGPDTLEYAEKVVKTMRGNDINVKELTSEEILMIDLNENFINSGVFAQRIMRAIYVCLNKADISLAVNLRNLVGAFVVKDIVIPGIGIDKENLYKVFYLMLCFNYIEILPDKSRWYIFGSSLLLFSMRIGYDLEEIMKRAVLSEINFYSRRNICLDCAVFLSENETVVGRKDNGDNATINFWIDTFRMYSKNNFGGVELTNFFNDEKYLSKCSGDERKLIRAVIQLYTHLVNGFLILPDGEMDKLNKMLDEGKIEKPTVRQIKDDIEETFTTNSSGEFLDIDGILLKLDELAKKFNDPKIAELYYFDEQQGKFVWKE